MSFIASKFFFLLKKYQRNFVLAHVFILPLLILNAQTSFAEVGEALKTIAIQDGGRIKPFDTFAKEMMTLVHGKPYLENKADQNYEGESKNDEYQKNDNNAAKSVKQPAHLVVMTWLLDPSTWSTKKLIEVKHHEVKSILGLKNEDKYFSLQEILSSQRLSEVMQALQSKRETKEKLNPYFQAVSRLENQIFVFQHIGQGDLIRLVPPKEGEQWLSLAQFEQDSIEKFQNMTAAFMATLSLLVDDNKSDAEAKEINDKFSAAVEQFNQHAQSKNPSLYPKQFDLKLEVHFNDFHPFRYAWIFAILSAIFALLVWILNKNSLEKAVWLTLFVSLFFQIYGFAIRSYLTGRPPVSNMYETVVWVGFGALIFAIAIELKYKYKFTLLAGNVVAAFCLILADLAPAVLDPSLQPLEPVLRSGFWLTIHVLVITISYAAFFLGFVLADIGLVYFFIDEDKHKTKIIQIAQAVYRSIQIGIVFLAPGIILGGIWADYSWGRFWGWDPKETWALIALLGYLAVLHARLVGWIRQFGMIVWGIVTFSLVIMAWYGVNFVLGAGLHSYGFGAGGVEYVSAFVGVHFIFVLAACYKKANQLKS